MRSVEPEFYVIYGTGKKLVVEFINTDSAAYE